MLPNPKRRRLPEGSVMAMLPGGIGSPVPGVWVDPPEGSPPGTARRLSVGHHSAKHPVAAVRWHEDDQGMPGRFVMKHSDLTEREAIQVAKALYLSGMGTASSLDGMDAWMGRHKDVVKLMRTAKEPEIKAWALRVLSAADQKSPLPKSRGATATGGRARASGSRTPAPAPKLRPESAPARPAPKSPAAAPPKARRKSEAKPPGKKPRSSRTTDSLTNEDVLAMILEVLTLAVETLE